MKKASFFITCVYLLCMILQSFAIAETDPMPQLGDGMSIIHTNAILDEEKGVYIMGEDFSESFSKTAMLKLNVTDINTDYFSKVTIHTDHQTDYVEYAGSNGIRMGTDDLSHSRLLITFNDLDDDLVNDSGEGLSITTGQFTTEYDVTVHGAEYTTCEDTQDRLVYNTDQQSYYFHNGALVAKILAAKGSFVHYEQKWTPPSSATALNSYSMYLKAKGRRFYDNIKIWHFPANAFILRHGEQLYMIKATGTTCTIPSMEGVTGWVADGVNYKPGDTVNVADLQYKTLRSADIVYELDETALALSYDFANTRAGSADGTVKISFSEENPATSANSIELMWGKGNTPLADYTAIATMTSTKFGNGYAISKSLAIPAEATSLIARVTDYEHTFDLVYTLPESKLVNGEPLYTVALASDFHIGWGTLSVRNSQKAAQAEINQLADFLIVNGDFTQWYGKTANAVEWELAEEYFKEFDIPVYFTKGNHDEYNLEENYPKNEANGPFDPNAYKDFLAMWLEYSDYEVDRPAGADYYDTTINGHHYIFLSGTTNGYFELGETQLSWLDQKLYEAEESGKPVFVLCHFPIRGKVNHPGTYTTLEDEAQLEAVLDRHPTAIYVSGHTHYTLYSELANTVNGGQLSPSYVNDGAVIDDINQAVDESDPNSSWSRVSTHSMGLIAEVYEDRVLLKGRDFTDKKWIAQGFSEVTFLADSEIETPIAEKSAYPDGKTVLRVKDASDALTYTWSINGVLQTGNTLTVDTATAGYIALRATDASGSYTSTVFSSMAEIADGCLPGDVNNDGTVNLNDVVRLLQYLVGWNVSIDQTAADLSRNSKISVYDAVKLLQMI